MTVEGDQLAAIIAATGAIRPSVVPDGSVFFLADRTGSMQLWSRPRSGEERRLTDMDRVGAYALDASGSNVAVVADTDGTQHWGLYVGATDGSSFGALSAAPGRVHQLVGWTADQSEVLAFSNIGDSRHLDLYSFPADGGEPRMLFASEGSGLNATPLADGGVVLSVHRDRMQHHHLVHVDSAGTARTLTPEGSPAKYEKPRAMGDGVLTLTNQGRDTIGVMFVGLDGSQEQFVEHEWDVQSLAVAGDRWAYEVNRDGLAEIHVVAGDADRVVDGHPVGALRSEIIDEPLGIGARGEVVFELHRYDHPTTIYLATPGTSAQLAVAPSMDGIDPAVLPTTEQVEFTSSDGLRIPGFLVGPRGGGTRPTIIDLHGGTGQSRPTWSASTVGLIACGFNVLFPNVRGSSGYGRRYQTLDERTRRHDSVRDVHEAAQWLMGEGIAPPDGVGIMGSSYGGYMTLASIAFHPESWRAAVELFGIADYERHLESLPLWRRRLRETEFGTLADDRELLRSISPLRSLDTIRAPLLVIHGANDTLVRLEQSELVVEGLRALGRDVEFLRFEDEGHMIRRSENIAVMVRRIVAFFERTMG